MHVLNQIFRTQLNAIIIKVSQFTVAVNAADSSFTIRFRDDDVRLEILIEDETPMSCG
jgi:hypothetical protein